MFACQDKPYDSSRARAEYIRHQYVILATLPLHHQITKFLAFVSIFSREGAYAPFSFKYNFSPDFLVHICATNIFIFKISKSSPKTPSYPKNYFSFLCLCNKLLARTLVLQISPWKFAGTKWLCIPLIPEKFIWICKLVWELFLMVLKVGNITLWIKNYC